MRAFTCHKYGSPKILQLEELPIPYPKPDQVRVKVLYTTINDWDWSLVRGKPIVYRSFYGLRKPKTPILGVELAGIVDKVGDLVDNFKPGDKVYGDISRHGWGSWAEYACVYESDIRHVPDGMELVDAASISHAAGLAWQALIDIGGLEKGQDLLINGGGGGVGTLGVQIARSYGTSVDGVDHGDKLGMMREFGFDQVFDYRTTDFTKENRKYDLILDTKTMKWPLSYLRALKPHGKYVTVGGGPGRILQLVALKPLLSWTTKKSLHMLPLKPNIGLQHFESLYMQAKIKTVIDGPYEFEAIPEQLQRFGEGRHRGKIVIKVQNA